MPPSAAMADGTREDLPRVAAAKTTCRVATASSVSGPARVTVSTLSAGDRPDAEGHARPALARLTHVRRDWKPSRLTRTTLGASASEGAARLGSRREDPVDEYQHL
jgi:hypothetical protein